MTVRGRTTTVVIGVDGGGTKTDVCVATPDGRVLAFVRAQAANWEQIGLEAMRTVVAATIAESLRIAGAGPDDVQAWVCCMAGVDWPSDVDRVGAALHAVLPVPPVVTNDAFASLRAGAPDGIGLVSVAGTGGVTAGRDRRGRTARTMGSTLGEGAGATGITRRALDAMARFHHGQIDGGEALAGALCAAVGCVDLAELFERMSRDRLAVGAAQAPIVVDLAEGGDALSRAVVTESARQQAADVIGIADQLRLGDGPVTVVAAGGVHTRAGPAFSGPFAEAVTGALPRAKIDLLGAPPASGAALLALDALRPVPPAVAATLLEGASAARRTPSARDGARPALGYGTAT
jgi:N-acetylglucosamine kinase-like BadF-type ATPase